MKPLKHIGIASITAEGGALVFREIVHAAEKLLGENIHPEITMHSHSFSKFTDTIATRSKDWANLIVASSRKLAGAGADFMICPSNTNHIEFDLVAEELPIPWLHIASAVAAEAQHRGLKRALLLGTRYLVESGIYPDYFAERNIDVILPNESEIGLIHTVIYKELVRGVFSEQSKVSIVKIIEQYASEAECDSVILGCTELPLLVAPTDISLSALDSTRILAHEAVNRALAIAPAETQLTLKR